MHSLTLADILTSPVATVNIATSARDALHQMRRNRISALVVTEDDKPVGILTERDAVLLAYRRRHTEKLKVGEIMGKPLLTALPDLDYRDGYRLITERQVRHLVVVDDAGAMLGIVTEGDFLHHLGDEFLVRFKEVGSVMIRQVLALPKDSWVDDAVRMMTRERVSCVVVEDKGSPVGIFTERDLVKLEADEGIIPQAPLSAHMSYPVKTVQERSSLPAAIRDMDESGIRRIVVVDEDNLVTGLVTRHDIVKQLYNRHIEHLTESLRLREIELDQTRAELDALQELQRVEDKLAETQRLSHIGSWELNIPKNELWWSDETYRIFENGPSRFRASYEAFLDLVHPEERDYVSQVYTDSVTNKTPYDIRHRLLFEDGRIKFVRERCETFYDDKGNPLRSIGTVQDITEDVLRQKERDRLHAMVEALIESSTDSIFVKDREGKYVLVNQALADLVGRPKSELLGQNDLGLFPRPVAEGFRTDDQAVKDEGKTRTYEEIVVAQGEGLPFLTTKGPLIIDEEVVGVFGIARDISAFRNTEKALEESERRLSTLMGNLPGMAYRCRNDEFWTAEFVSEGCRELTGYEAGALINNRDLSLADLVDPRDAVKMAESVQQAIETREPYEQVYRIKHADGSWRWVWGKGRCISEPGVQPEILEGFTTDITLSRQADEKLRYRLKLESALAVMSADLVQLEDGNLDAGINAALERIGAAVGADRSYLFQVRRKASVLSNTHEWCADGVEPQMGMFEAASLEPFLDAVDLLATGQVLNIALSDGGEDLPELRKHMGATGIQSMVNVPLTGVAEYEGFIGFDSEQSDKPWPQEDISVLLTAAEIFGTAIERQRNTDTISQHTWYLESLDRVSRLLSENQFSSDMMDSLMDLILELFDADRAWVLDPCDPAAPEHRLTHESTRSEFPGALAAGGLLPTNPANMQILREALVSQGPFMRHASEIRDPQDLMHQFGTKSEMMMVLRPQGTAPQLMGIHQCQDERHWTNVEQSLFHEICDRAAMVLSGTLLLERIRGSENRLLEAEHIARMGHWDLDIATGLAHWSDEIHDIFGTRADQPVGPALLSHIVNPEDWPALEASLTSTMQDGSPHEMEYRVRRPDGEERWVFCKGEQEQDEQGRPLRINGIVQDITRRKAAEAELARSSLEWTQAMDQLNDVVYLLDMDRKLVRANQAFYQMIDSDPQHSVGRHIVELVHPEGEDMPCPVCQAQEHRREGSFTLEAEDPVNPSGHPMEVALKLIRDESGQPTSMLMNLHDLTHTREINERLRLSASVFDNTAEAIVVMQADGKVIEVNEAFEEIVGYSRDEVIGQSSRLWQSERHDEAFYEGKTQALRETGRWRGEVWIRRKDGKILPEWQNISAVHNSRGEVTHYVSVSSDISQIKRSQEQLARLAHYDSLTGLPNRLLLMERLEQAMRRAKRQGFNVAVLFIDIDRFKHVNDSLGHPAGDKLLQGTAKLLMDSVRSDDTVARLGGDEFVVILESVEEPEQVGSIAQKLLDVFGEPLALEGRDISVSASIGVCIYPNDGEDTNTLLRNADAAMYRAKEEGRNTYRFYTEELTREAFERVLLEANLRRAIEKEELYLNYQPQVDLATGAMVGMEALVRWRHPDLGVVAPSRFVPLAEDTGLILRLGTWVLEHACRQAQEWLSYGIEFGRVAVNVAGPQIQRGELVETVRRVLAETGLPAGYLELEVTEGFIMQQADAAIEQLATLQDMGVLISIDDFGTGYSSLSYLKRLPIDKLKIDQSFVRDIPQDSNDMAIASAVIALGKSMGLKVIAEGVETGDQVSFLTKMGCEEAQGFFYSHPVSEQELQQYFAERGMVKPH